MTKVNTGDDVKRLCQFTGVCVVHNTVQWQRFPTFLSNTRAVRKVSNHFEYPENRSRGLDVTWQPVRGDRTVHP